LWRLRGHGGGWQGALNTSSYKKNIVKQIFYRLIERIIERSNKRSVPKDGAFYTVVMYFLSLKLAILFLPSSRGWSVGRIAQGSAATFIH
jgi:hypothetical protein